MKPTRQTQPYRQGARHPGAALQNMLRGRTTGGWNPKDLERLKMLQNAGKRAQRPSRAPRPQRPPR
jgi:hypothetical protein